MENKSFLEFTENKMLKIILLLILVIVALLYVYFVFLIIPPEYDPYYTKPNFLALILLFPFFPIGLLNSISLFLGIPEAPYPGIAAIIIAPFLWSVYLYIGALYISLRRPRSYIFLVMFFIILVLNVAGCSGLLS